MIRYRPAPLWRRVIASIYDQSISSIYSLPIYPVLMLVNSTMVPALFPSSTQIVEVLMQVVFTVFVTFYYFGWFNRNRGATPGKLALRLILVQADTGERVPYSSSFLREIVGKAIGFMLAMIIWCGLALLAFVIAKGTSFEAVFSNSSSSETLILTIWIMVALILGFVLWMGAWRKDGRALHDLMAGTQVVYFPNSK